MNYLYCITYSSGAPRQRTFRGHHEALVSGSSSNHAARRGAELIAVNLRGNHRPRVESAVMICATPDLVATTTHGAPL